MKRKKTIKRLKATAMKIFEKARGMDSFGNPIKFRTYFRRVKKAYTRRDLVA